MEKDAPQMRFMITKCQERASLSEWGKKPHYFCYTGEGNASPTLVFEISKPCPVRSKIDLKSIGDFSGGGDKIQEKKKIKIKLQAPPLTQGDKGVSLGLTSKAMLQQLGYRTFYKD